MINISEAEIDLESCILQLDQSVQKRGLQGPHTKTFRAVINTGEATERQINER